MQDWDEQVRGDILVSPLRGDSHSLADVLRFVLTFERRQRAKKRHRSSPCERVLMLARRACVSLLSKLSDKVIRDKILPNQDCAEQAAPSQQFPDKP